MRTIAIRVEEEFREQLVLLGQLSGRSLTDEVIEALNQHIARRSEEVDLTAQAQAALDEIDREHATRRGAIESLLSKKGSGAESTKPVRKSGRSQGQ
jgi:hypothetical protein